MPDTGIKVRENIHLEDDESALEYFYKIGLNHIKYGNPKDAIFYFDKVLSIDPTHFNAMFNKGNMLGKMGKYEYAIIAYNDALKIKPEHPVCLLNKGLALHYLAKYVEAVECYDKIIANSPHDSQALYQKACTRARQNNVEDALLLLEHAVRSDPNNASRAAGDKDFDVLYNDERFHALIS